MAWRTSLAQHTRVSPHTINRRLAVVKRLVAEAALQGTADKATAETFARITGVKVLALKTRRNDHAHRITPDNRVCVIRRRRRASVAGATGPCCIPWPPPAVGSRRW